MSTIKVTNLKHESSASDNIALDSSGRVGVGTSSPDQTLSVGSGAADTRMSINGTGQYQLKFTNSGANGFWIGSPGANSLAFAQDDGATRMTIDSSGNLKFNSGYGSAATAYGCRAWVNFNGTGTVAIRASGNVSSITDSGTGKYRANFTNSMPDAYYAAEVTVIKDDAADNNDMYATIGATGVSGRTPTTTYVPITTTRLNTALVDCPVVNVVIIR